MKRLTYIITFALLTLTPSQLMAVAPNITPIISYLLSDGETTPESSHFTKGSPLYFISENGTKGFRTLSDTDNTYTQDYTPLVGANYPSTVYETGTYSISDDTLTLTVDGGGTRVLEYLAPADYGDGKTFSVSFNGGTAVLSHGYTTEALREAGIIAATSFMHDFFTYSTRYYLNENFGIGQRSFYYDNGTVPYTGQYNAILNGDWDNPGLEVNGDYAMSGDTLVLERSNGTVVVIEHIGATEDLDVNDFNVSINGATAIQTTMYRSQDERNLARFPGTIGNLTPAEFSALTQINDISNLPGSWWYIESSTEGENIVFSTPVNNAGTVDIDIYVNDVIDESEALFYTVENGYLGLQETSGGTTLENLKVYEELSKTDLEALYPHITFSNGAEGIKVAGTSLGEAFDPWTDSGDFATVNYSSFSDLITGMISGNSSTDDDRYVTGNGVDAIVFQTGSTTAGGNVVNERTNVVAGTYEIKDVDGTSTLVVTITDSAFEDTHIAFQLDGPIANRGSIYDIWSDIWVNDTAKDDVFDFFYPAP